MEQKAKALAARYDMATHQENGTFIETHYVNQTDGRAASGSMYYYIAPGEKSQFHRIDCDEYWCYNAGDSLELWIIDPDGGIRQCRLGIEEGCEPTVYLKQGVIFAAKHYVNCEDGTFLTCITVPRFSYDGFEMFDRETILKLYPDTVRFFE